MKKQILTIFSLLFFCNFSFSIERPSFLNAVARNIITPTIQGKSEERKAYGEAVEISIQNNTNKTIETVVEKGTILESQNPSTQDMVVSKDLTLRVDPYEYLDPPLSAFCIEYSKDAPNTGDFFKPPNKIAHGDLMKIVNYIDRNNLHNNMAAQIAVWSITDNLTPQQLKEEGYIDFDNTLAKTHSILTNCNINSSFSNSSSGIGYILGMLLYVFIAVLIILFINKSI